MDLFCPSRHVFGRDGCKVVGCGLEVLRQMKRLPLNVTHLSVRLFRALQKYAGS